MQELVKFPYKKPGLMEMEHYQSTDFYRPSYTRMEIHIERRDEGKLPLYWLVGVRPDGKKEKLEASYSLSALQRSHPSALIPKPGTVQEEGHYKMDKGAQTYFER